MGVPDAVPAVTASLNVTVIMLVAGSYSAEYGAGV